MSAPSGSRDNSQERRRYNSRPKWINPCGMTPTDQDFDAELVDYIPRLNDFEILNQIIVQGKNALLHAQRFKDDYVKKTFNLDVHSHHETWRSNHYDWLPSPNDIPKNLGERTSLEHLKNLELDTALRDTYEYLQKFAVGLEQIVWDQEDENGEFRQEFNDTEFKLRALLCEIQVAMIERNVMQKLDVERNIMGAEYRGMTNTSYRNLRDWLIFRDYMNGLEYIIQVFEFFKENISS